MKVVAFQELHILLTCEANFYICRCIPLIIDTTVIVLLQQQRQITKDYLI